MSCFLGIDSGTSGVKALILDGEGAVQGIGYQECNVINPEPGFAEQDPMDWWRTCCGAVNAAIKGGACGNIKMITDKIRLDISGERDDCAASRLNVEAEVNAIKKALAKANLCAETIGAIYRTDTGEVEFLENSENL